ncbi:MAG: methionyl-tRNA formyltransferase [candidate division WOR-3 bacterium]
MRLVFFGSGTFALPALRALKNSTHELLAVITAPPAPQGRGLKTLPTPVAQLAAELGIPTLTPESPNSEQFLARLRELSPDCGVIVDYGYILKPALLTIPVHGFINLHPSLLPRYRGPAPIPRQLMEGCELTGVTIFQLDSGIDTGDILNQVELPILPDETAGELALRLAEKGAELLCITLDQISTGNVQRIPQNPALASRAPKITKSERWIDWRRPAQEIHNHIRALAPQPGALTRFRNRDLQILRSRKVSASNPETPGAIITDKNRLIVAAGTDRIEILELKPAGGKIITGRDFINGYHPQPGEIIGV